jgi:hypothetical protein
MAVKKGDLVKVIKEKLVDSVEAKASDTRFPLTFLNLRGKFWIPAMTMPW